MQNRTDIINTALQRCGAAGVNLAFQDTQEAAIATAAYDRCRRLLLTQYVWNFAKRYTTLAQNTTTPGFGYQYSFTLPGDCVQIVDVHRYKVNDDGEIVPPDMFRHLDAKYEVVGRNIFSNEPLLALRYVSDEEISMPEAFANALAWLLAFEISPYLQQGEASKSQQFYQLYQQALDDAKVDNDIQQPNPENVPDWRESKFVRNRFAGVWD